MKTAQQRIELPFCALCNAPLDPDTPPGRKVCDGCMGNGADAYAALVGCSKCNRVLPHTAEYFYRATKKKSGFQGECKECHNKAARTNRESSKKHNTKAKFKPGEHGPELVSASSISKRLDPIWDQNSAIVTLDLSSYPDLLVYLSDLSRDQERSLEGQIRWILRQCYKFRTETPSAACGEV